MNFDNDPRWTELPEWVQIQLREFPLSGQMGEDDYQEVQFSLGPTTVQTAVVDRKWCVLPPDQVEDIKGINWVFDEDGEIVPFTFERHQFCDMCPGCRPALADQSGRVVPDDDLLMVEILRIWRDQTNYHQRKAFIEVTLHNSRSESDLRLANEVVEMFKARRNG